MPADYHVQVATDSGPMVAPATSMVWQQQYQGQQNVFGVVDLMPDTQSFDKELSMLRQRAHEVTSDRLHLQPHLSPLTAPATAADTAMERFSLFGAVSMVAQTDRLHKRQCRSSSGSPPPPQELLGALPMAASPWLAPSSVDLFADAQASPTSRPAAKKPRHAGPAAATQAEEEMAEDAASSQAATQLFLQQILADLYADQDPTTITPGPQFPQLVLAAPGPLEPVQVELVPVADPTPDPVVPAPVSPAAGPVHPPQTGNNHGRNRKHQGGLVLLCTLHGIVKEVTNLGRHNLPLYCNACHKMLS
jgi:hypothetical protein